MGNLLSYIANGLVILGMLVLISALFQVKKIVRPLEKNQVRRKWYVQSGLILLFVIGYLGYAVQYWKSYSEWQQLIVPGVFFFGAIFVWLTISLALQTTLDIRRIALLEQENITDPIVGIYNRRYLDRRLTEEFARAQRYHHDLAILLIDIDHFKNVNDKYGHAIGDQVLHKCGSLIQDHVRATDTVARFGGDEIMIIAPMTSSTTAMVLAERIRSSIDKYKCIIRGEDHQAIKIVNTVSIGVSCISASTGKVDVLIHEADMAMYDAKKAGRNRVALGGRIRTETEKIR